MDNKPQKRLLGIDDKNIAQEEKNIDEGLKYVNSRLTEIIDDKEYLNSNVPNLIKKLSYIQEKVIKLNIHKHQAETYDNLINRKCD